MTSITETLSHLQIHWQTLSQRLSFLNKDIQTTTQLLQRHGEIFRAPLNVLKHEKKEIKNRMKEIVAQVEEVRVAMDKSEKLIRKINNEKYESNASELNNQQVSDPNLVYFKTINDPNLVYVKTDKDALGINTYITKA